MSWTRIQGHDRWIKVFADVVRNQRLAHAYLFLGPEGVGKRMFAQELAKTLLCEGRGEIFAACDRCPACLLVDAGTHPDAFGVQRWSGPGDPPPAALDPDKKYLWQGNFGYWLGREIPINLMRDLCRKLSMKPARGHGKVAILDDSDDFNDPSANCFLKTLEEPPPGSGFILVGTSRDLQIPTIVSRCQEIHFAPLPAKQVRELLEKQGTPAELVPRLTRLASGSPGQALALADPALWQFRQVLIEGLAKPRLDSVALAKAWTEFAEDAGKETSSHRRRAGLVLRLLQAFLSDALLMSLGGEPNMQDPGERNLLFQLCGRAGPEKILALLERTLETEKHLDRYIQVAIVLEATMDTFARLLNREPGPV